MLINNFPIQIFSNRILVNTSEEFYNLVDRYNGKTTIFYSLYQVTQKNNNSCFCNSQDYHSCFSNVDKIVFDNDTFDLPAILSAHYKLLSLNIKHLITFSGLKGFHLYIFTKNFENLKYNKEALLNSQLYLITLLNLDNFVDKVIIGDINRLFRLPNTVHMGSKLYCIQLSTSDLQKGKEHIFNEAKTQHKLTYYGTDYFDISLFDKPTTKIILNSIVVTEIKTELKTLIDNNLYSNLPSCILNMLSQSYVAWRNRFHILKYLIDSGYTDEEIDKIMKHFLSDKKHSTKGYDNYNHFLSERQFTYVKNNNSLFSCNKIKSEKLCPIVGLCQHIIEHPIYMKIR